VGQDSVNGLLKTYIQSVELRICEKTINAWQQEQWDIINRHREPVYEALFLIDFCKDLRFYLYAV
jgi:hypothetical protein